MVAGCRLLISSSLLRSPRSAALELRLQQLSAAAPPRLLVAVPGWLVVVVEGAAGRSHATAVGEAAEIPLNGLAVGKAHDCSGGGMVFWNLEGENCSSQEVSKGGEWWEGMAGLCPHDALTSDRAGAPSGGQRRARAVHATSLLELASAGLPRPPHLPNDLHCAATVAAKLHGTGRSGNPVFAGGFAGCPGARQHAV